VGVGVRQDGTESGDRRQDDEREGEGLGRSTKGMDSGGEGRQGQEKDSREIEQKWDWAKKGESGNERWSGREGKGTRKVCRRGLMMVRVGLDESR